MLRERRWLEQKRREELRADIQQGIASGPATPLDMAAVKAEARRPRQGWAESFAAGVQAEAPLIPDTITNAWDAHEWQ